MKAAKSSRRPTVSAPPNNLPNYLTSFVGREGELTALKSLLARSRMVTLAGPGGAGKSRLAAELGRTCLELWPGGVWWVELATLSDGREVAGAVVATLKLSGRGPALDVVAASLADRQAVLVLDNCEHLVAACADFCQAVLGRCPQLAIVATSREALGVAGETRWPVSSMHATDAVQLLETRARLVLPDFKVMATNLEAVTQMCERLDRMPLAIELAAARLGMMTEQEILSQLSDRFGLLTGGNRTAQERHQTMMATIDWSYRLLTDDEGELFRRLSVFRGGFTLESVLAICAEGIAGSGLDLLTGLVQKSMVVADRPEDSASRYRLLESQLVYAEDRLRQAGQLELVARRHYQYFLDALGAKLGPQVLPPRAPGAAEAAWIAREWGNLWAATGWARSNADDGGLLVALRLAQCSFPDITAMRRLMRDVLDRSGETAVLRMSALAYSSGFANVQGDYNAALSAAGAALALAREIGDAEALAYQLLRSGNVHQVHGDADTAAATYDEAIALLKNSSNKRLLAGIKNNFGLLLVERGDYASARDILVECVAEGRGGGDVSETAAYLDSLAWAEVGLGDLQEATAHWKESLSTFRSILDDFGTIWCLFGLSCAASASGDDVGALRLAGAAARRSDQWFRYDYWIPTQSEKFQQRSRSRLGAPKSEEAWKEGWAMTVHQAVDYALREAKREALVDARPLSRRE